MIFHCPDEAYKAITSCLTEFSAVNITPVISMAVIQCEHARSFALQDIKAFWTVLLEVERKL